MRIRAPRHDGPVEPRRAAGRTEPTRDRPSRRARATRPAAGALALGLAATLGSGAAASATGATAATPDPSVAQQLPSVTVTPDPGYRGKAFEGWGTSLVWFANATGGYPDEIRERLADMLFGDDGLRLNIARYNVGGGNAPDVPDYLRAGGAVPGWWQAPEGTTRDDVDWWDPEDPDHWDEDADPGQRWWVDRIKDDVTHWEAFSNSPPWFQTVNGYTSGGFSATTDQIRDDRVDDFAAYMTGVVERLEDAHGVEFDTIDPLNEPNTDYWSTRLGPDGDPVGGRQEGAHAGPESQQRVIAALDRALETAGTDAVISAMDETNPGTFAANWYAYSPEVRDVVEQLNVHTYGTGQRPVVRDIAKGWDKTLWMSEVGTSWGDRQDFEAMGPGLTKAQRIVDDLRELEPTAWVFWQPIEDLENMSPGGEFPLGGNWGAIQVPFDCTAEDTLETCPVRVNTKFDTVRNFTHHIQPGDHLIGVDDTSSVAAETRRGATVVHVNGTTDAREVVLDLSKFRAVLRGATVTPVVTDVDGGLQQGEPVRVVDDRARLVVPAESVTTFVVSGVRGADPREALVQEGGVYRLAGVESGRALTADGDAAVLGGTAVGSADDLWSLEVVAGRGNQTEYALVSRDDRLLTDVDGTTRLVARTDEVPAGARWVGSTTGDETFTFVNRGTTRLLEVGGRSTAEGAAVGTWQATGAGNQRWQLVDETVQGTEPVRLFTPVGTAPDLPATVTAQLRDGAGGQLPVTWSSVPPRAWAQPGERVVRGTAVDLTGRQHRATATVVVDRLTGAEDAAARTVRREPPVLPPTVAATGTLGVPVERPVVWEAVTTEDVAELGTVEVAGTVDTGDGRTLPVTARVEVVVGTPANVATEDGVELAATFTEPGYSVEGLRDGRTTDKAWSTWVPGTQRAGDAVVAALPRERTVTGVRAHVVLEGSDTSPATALVQVRDAASGEWVDASERVVVPARSPVVEVPVGPADADGARTDGVRLVLENRPGGYLVLSELEVLARVAG